MLRPPTPPPHQMAPRTCTEPITRSHAGKQPGDPCGCACVTGTDKCWQHTPELMAERTAKRKRGELPRCIARYEDGNQCTKAPMAGQEVCRKHGGGRPVNQRAGADRVAEEKARKKLASMKIVPVENSLLELQKIAGHAVAWMEVCSGVKDTLDAADWRYESKQQLEQIRGEVTLFMQALSQAADIVSALSRAQVDDRLVRIEERRLELTVKALTKALGDSEIDAETANVIRVSFAKELRAIGNHKPAAPLGAARKARLAKAARAARTA